MPTYQYECEKCGTTFEIVQSMKDAPIEVCPKEHCGKVRWGKGKVRRVPSGGAGLIFKGSGFYITDYRSDSYKAAAKKDGTPSSSEPATKSAEKKPGGSASESKSAGTKKD
jgi:putative FmdB family regulatory protein